MVDAELSQSVSAFTSPTFEKDGSFEVDKPVGSMSISPCGRDVVLASYVLLLMSFNIQNT